MRPDGLIVKLKINPSGFFFYVKQALTRDTLTVIFSLLGKSSSAIYIHVTKIVLRLTTQT